MPEEKTEISDIKGVGPKLAERIEQTLDIDSVDQLLEITEEQLTEVKGIGSSKAEKILNNIKEMTNFCSRCGEKYVGKGNCPECTAELEEELETIREDIESFKEDTFPEKRWHIGKILEKTGSKLSEGKFKEVTDLITSVREEFAKTQQLSDKLSEVEERLDEKKAIALSTYEEELRLAREYMRHGDYEEAHNRADKILDYLEEEKRYRDADPLELLKENVEEFSKHMMGIGLRDGEKIYGSGLRTLEDVYKAGSKKLQKKADIEESKAERLVDALDLLFEDLEIEREREEETLQKRDDEETTKEEEIFSVAQEKKEEEKEKKETKSVSETKKKERPKKPKKVKKKKVVKKRPKKKKGSISTEELLSLEKEQIQKNEKELKYWIPAIIIPIILAIAAYVLFYMF
ncbi:MAG: hypothetical protein KGY66_07635 [Candidatus Thermoplasmatota archaeon]|nr:hypothetical protein [Candidatus Thermoplasmatota archaeon]MBS3790769.1 hypothetical protein [Candidatus Thermoplasmatota archaeon]